ncbi:sodium- and chloride-dependent glycine transporter 2-like [Amyelois transitella]|uniref:sodium- and chloride-dependent glycine transporter 2-like n=1 Tax=Amyelois transitella TaxID=680683 RepID=UPI0029900FC8|nr:sodium- and chloride-dependent glycine transporter 2-like [Amyelois transitella]
MEFNYKPPSTLMSRRGFLMMALCQALGINIFITMPNNAVTNGAMGHIIAYTLIYLLIGIPVLYMEFVISQFTERDCIDVWKVRPCLSHIGYLNIMVQICIIVNNHTYNSFLLHFLLVSFESPIPFYSCRGSWNTKHCNLLANNYSVREDCLRSKEYFSYCKDFHNTFPEVQYFRYYVIGQKSGEPIFIAWRMLLSSIVICIIVYLGNLKNRSTVQVSAELFTFVPLIGYATVMLGSMVQKGIVKYFEEALDVDMDIFLEKSRLSGMIQQVLNALRIGSGVPLNLGSLAAFHAPCYSNTVVVVIVCSTLVVLATCTTAMMYCPYAYRFTISPSQIMKTELSVMFEKLPRLMYEYDGRKCWLILAYGSATLFGMGTNTVLISHIMDLAIDRSKTVAKYPGLVRFIGISLLFVLTIPLLGITGLTIVVILRQVSMFITLLLGIAESLVFVVWYGVGRFAEDVHFMQGIRPGCYMKTVWVLSSVLLSYVLCSEFYRSFTTMTKLQDYAAMITLLVCIIIVLGIFLVKITVAACKNRFVEEFKLDPTWGPKNLILKRSRAMFTAQAMTKEYMYRQHQLQAGVMQRQRAANLRERRSSSPPT